jgi:ribosomal protein S27E
MNWLRRMMMGRYGADQLNFALLILGMVMNFIPWFPIRIVSILVMVLVIFRMFSKNIYKRQRENSAFLKVWYPVKNFFVRLFKGRPDKATHIHMRCPKCHTEMRVPRNVGTIMATCPSCGEKIKKNTGKKS